MNSEDAVTQLDDAPDRSILRAGGVPEAAVDAWLGAVPAATGVFAEDARSHGVFWRLCDELIGHLPGKPGRAPAQAKAADAVFAKAREMRERFLRTHVEAVYADVTARFLPFRAPRGAGVRGGRAQPGPCAVARSAVAADASTPVARQGRRGDRPGTFARGRPGLRAQRPAPLSRDAAAAAGNGGCSPGWRPTARRSPRGAVQRRGRARISPSNPRHLNAEDHTTLASI